MNRKPRVKYVKPMPNRERIRQNMEAQVNVEKIEEKKEEVMINNETITQMENILNNVKKEDLPKRKVKVEKKDKSLIERTENSKIILTEDNKMLLND